MALLFSLTLWSGRHIDRNTETCTDRKCTWDVPRKESKPKLLDEIEQSSEQSRVLPNENNFDPTAHSLNNCDIDVMLLDLVKGFDTQIIEVLDTSANDNNCEENVPKTLKQCISQFNPIGNISVFDYLSTCIDENDCNEINRLTDHQSESVNWYKYRHGRITSSILHNACHYKGNDPNNYIVKQILSNDCTSLSTPATVYGKEREVLARNLYEKMYVAEHKGAKLKTSGLIIDSSKPHLGASPDGILQCKCCGTGVLEIKCPYKFRNLTVDQIYNENYHIQKDENECMKLKETSNWYTQIQTQMAVANVQWCDFVLYLEGDVKNGKHKIHSERIHFDPSLWHSLFRKSKIFFENFLLPKLSGMIKILKSKIACFIAIVYRCIHKIFL